MPPPVQQRVEFYFMISVVPNIVAFYKVDIMVQDGISHVQTNGEWYS
jgi:hypothetical protein